jgi:hypothetical protein
MELNKEVTAMVMRMVQRVIKNHLMRVKKRNKIKPIRLRVLS